MMENVQLNIFKAEKNFLRGSLIKYTKKNIPCLIGHVM